MLLSEKTPVAANCWVVPRGMLEMPGGTVATVMDTSVAVVTVREVVPDILPDATAYVAVIVVVPGPTEAASPLEPDVLLIVATLTEDELQVTDAVRF